MPAIPTQEPTSLQAGDTLQWTRQLDDFPASAGWQLSYRLIGSAGSFAITAAAQGDLHAIAITADASGAWPAGSYMLLPAVSKDSDRYSLPAIPVQVLANLAGSTAATDTRSYAQRVLDAVEAILEGRAGSAESDVQINGRALRYFPIADLLALRDRMRQEVRSEQASQRAAAGLGSKAGRVFVRFSAP